MRDATPVQGTPASRAGLSGATSLLGRFLVVGLVAAAGVAGWIGVERLSLEEDAPIAATATFAGAELPELGDGLPSARLESPEPWRRFSLTSTIGDRTVRYWTDLDRWAVRTMSLTDSGTDSVEILGDRGYIRPAGSAEWTEHDAQTTRDMAAFLLGGIGPFVLTDLIPPGALGFTTLELEGTSRGERVYEVSVDAATLREQHPLAHERWVGTTPIVNDGSSIYRIRVRPDGYIVRIDGENSSVQWEPLLEPVDFSSPLAAELPVESLTPVSTVATGAEAPAVGSEPGAVTDQVVVAPTTTIPAG